MLIMSSSGLSGLTGWMRLVLALGLTLGLAVLLSACGKPPGCSSSETNDLILGIAKDNAIKMVQGFQLDQAGDPEGILERFFKEVRLKFSQVTEDGYDSNSKTRTCSAVLSLEVDGKKVGEQQARYGLRRDESGEPLLVMGAISEFSLRVFGAAKKDFYARRYAKGFGGSLSCALPDGSKATIPVEVNGFGLNSAWGQYITPKNETEKLAGELGLGPRSDLSVSQEARSGNRWHLNFSGQIQNDAVPVSGRLSFLEKDYSSIGMDCTGTLQLGQKMSGKPTLMERPPAPPPEIDVSLVGDYTGKTYMDAGSADLALEIYPPDAEGRYKVLVDVLSKTCAGGAIGVGKLHKGSMLVDLSNGLGRTCQIKVARFNDKLGIHEEDCTGMRGNLCKFSGQVTKTSDTPLGR